MGSQRWGKARCLLWIGRPWGERADSGPNPEPTPRTTKEVVSVGLFLGRSASFKTSHIKRDRGNECPAPLRDKPTSNKARQNAKAAGGKNPLLLCSAARIPLRRRRSPSALASRPRSSYYARSCGGASCRVADHGCRRPGGPDGGVSCGGHPLARACGASG